MIADRAVGLFRTADCSAVDHCLAKAMGSLPVQIVVFFAARSSPFAGPLDPENFDFDQRSTGFAIVSDCSAVDSADSADSAVAVDLCWSCLAIAVGLGFGFLRRLADFFCPVAVFEAVASAFASDVASTARSSFSLRRDSLWRLHFPD